MHSLEVNGFWARDLDADDHEFLEYVKTHGIANGSLPNNSAVLLEELEFWHLPYTIAPNTERRVGRRPRVVETDEQRELRRARTNAWHARRKILEQERAIAAAELERERREWEEANARRKLREKVSDAEWDAAAPHKATFGKTVDRHYVPQWKLEELGIKTAAKPRSLSKRELEIIKRRVSEEWLQWRQKQEQKDKKEQERRQNSVLQKAFERKRKREQEAQEQEQKRREQIIAETRHNLQRLAGLERKEVVAASYPTDESLKRAILTLLKGSAPYVWAPDEMMRSLGCADQEFMDRCLDELVHEGQLRKLERA